MREREKEGEVEWDLEEENCFVGLRWWTPLALC